MRGNLCEASRYQRGKKPIALNIILLRGERFVNCVGCAQFNQRLYGFGSLLCYNGFTKITDFRKGNYYMSEETRMILEQLGQINENILVMKEDISVLKTDVAELKTDVAGLKTDVAGLKTDVAGLKTDVAELKTDVAGLKTDVAELKTDVAVLKTDVTNLKSEVSQMKSDMVVLNSGVEKLEERQRELCMLVENDISKKINIVGDGHFFVMKSLNDLRGFQNEKERMDLKIIDLQIEVTKIKNYLKIA